MVQNTQMTTGKNVKLTYSTQIWPSLQIYVAAGAYWTLYKILHVQNYRIAQALQKMHTVVMCRRTYSTVVRC